MFSVRLLDNFDKKLDVLRNTTFHIIRNTKFVNVWHFHFRFPNARTKQDLELVRANDCKIEDSYYITQAFPKRLEEIIGEGPN